MNCLLEVLAGAYIRARQKMVGEVPEDDVHGAQEGLEQCRRNMESREAALAESAKRLAGEAVQKRRQNDPAGARAKVMERRRVQQRLDKLRNGISIVDAQLDTIRNSELDKEIMQSLKASTTALKRAGVGVVVADAENIMQDLDDTFKDVQDITSVLAAPTGLNAGGVDDMDLDAELDQLMDLDEPEPQQRRTTSSVAASREAVVVLPVNSMREERAADVQMGTRAADVQMGT